MRRRGREIPPGLGRTALRRNVRRIASLAVVLLLPASGGSAGGAEAPAPSLADTVQVPEVWKTPPAAPDGTSWYRCRVLIPESWRGREVRFFLEPVDDAREIVVNGVTVGGVGRFPPVFRSGLGGADRHTVGANAIRWGDENVVAIRVHAAGGRTGFNVAPPAILSGDEGIVLSGAWQVLLHDDAAWGRAADRSPADPPAFATIRPAAEIEATLHRLPDEDGPLDVAASLARLTVPDDLVVEAVLAEPDIGQPLFLDFDERGRLWVMNYRQYPHPAGLTAVSRDAFLRTVYDRKSAAPPQHVPGRDRITFHEDTDGDGIYDRHGTFVEGLNIATAFARGRGGVFVLNPPHLLFYADRDGDDVPDGDPEVLLEGFGLEDTHSVASHLRWGPDGWLYGAQGSTVTAAIRRPGSDEEPRHSMGQLIWRYHPETRRYEVFAEGGGNAFGLEIDAKGRIFSGHNGGDTRGFHYVQGGFYRKGFGKHGELSNPHAFGFFEALDHAAVPRFTHTFVIDEGGGLPPRHAGRLFAVAPLQSHVVASEIRPRGSTFRTADVGFLLESRDPWFRPVEIKLGPDGGIFVADFHEQRIDHASHHQGRVTPDTGRVYRVRSAAAPAPARFDYRGWPAERLVELLRHHNRWHRQIALRMLADRRDAAVLPRLRAWLDEGTGQTALESLWAIHLVGGLDEPLAIHALDHADPHVRLWTVRLLADAGRVPATVAARLRLLAAAEPEVEVRTQLAASARRLPADQALPIVAALCRHDADGDDPLQPLSLWWALEAQAAADREAVLAVFADEALWRLPLVREHLLERLMRRFAQAGGRHDLLACGRLLDTAPDADAAATLLRGFEAAFAGRTVTALPDAVAAAVARAGGGSLGLRVRQGDAGAILEALEVVQDPGRPLDERIELAEILGQVRAPGSLPVLMRLFAAEDPRLCTAALAAAEAHADPEIAPAIIAIHDRLPAAARPVAQAVLASRPVWREAWLEALEAGRLAPADVAADVVERLSRAEEPGIADRVHGLWAAVATRDDGVSQAEVERLASVIAAAEGSPAAGRTVFRTHCGTCHVLFAEGGRIGPDLTAYQRDDLRRMLLNVVNPSHEIRAGYEQFVALTVDGRSVNGFITDQDDRVVVLRAADGREIVLARDEIDQLEAIPRSIMPEKLLDPLDDRQIRDLFAYLRATQPLPP
jgi:putative membrane-bound dehydrogenase-like protein